MRTLLVSLLIFSCFQAYPQKYISNSSEVTFFSEAPLEDIEAVNRSSNSVFDISNGDIVFSVPIREFDFERSLMKKHFNQNYMDSDKVPSNFDLSFPFYDMVRVLSHQIGHILFISISHHVSWQNSHHSSTICSKKHFLINCFFGGMEYYTKGVSPF